MSQGLFFETIDLEKGNLMSIDNAESLNILPKPELNNNPSAPELENKPTAPELAENPVIQEITKDKEQKKENNTPQRLLSGEKMRVMLEDEECKKALYACFRALANLGISVIDFLPGMTGELPSWAADAVKIFKVAKAKNIERKKKEKNTTNGDKASSDKESQNFWEKLDPTPDVPIWIASGSEFVEFIPGGFPTPTHLVESIIQFKHDLPNIKKGLEKIKEIWGAETVEELKTLADKELNDYQGNQPEINQAIEAFKN